VAKNGQNAKYRVIERLGQLTGQGSAEGQGEREGKEEDEGNVIQRNVKPTAAD
jgi:hypothetical protein